MFSKGFGVREDEGGNFVVICTLLFLLIIAKLETKATFKYKHPLSLF